MWDAEQLYPPLTLPFSLSVLLSLSSFFLALLLSPMFSLSMCCSNSVFSLCRCPVGLSEKAASHMMALTVNLLGPSPWGFRISGGRDFKKAITVSKVTMSQSNAECSSAASHPLVFFLPRDHSASPQYFPEPPFLCGACLCPVVATCVSASGTGYRVIIY